MRFQERDASSKRKYSKISLHKRNQLIERVVHRQQPLPRIVKRLNINISTARRIVKLYRETGCFAAKNFKFPPKEPIPTHSTIELEANSEHASEQAPQPQDIINNTSMVLAPAPSEYHNPQWMLVPQEYVFYPYFVWL